MYSPWTKNDIYLHKLLPGVPRLGESINMNNSFSLKLFSFTLKTTISNNGNQQLSIINHVRNGWRRQRETKRKEERKGEERKNGDKSK